MLGISSSTNAKTSSPVIVLTQAKSLATLQPPPPPKPSSAVLGPSAAPVPKVSQSKVGLMVGPREPVVDLTRDNPPVAVVPRQVSSNLKVRASIDYNNTLNVERAGQRKGCQRHLDRIGYNAGEDIRDWLKRSESHRVGICSYIYI